VTPPSYPVETSKKKVAALALSKRIFLVLLIWGIEMLYIPTSNRVAGGIEPRLSIDIFPIWSIWVVPYVLCYVLWLVSFLWSILKMEDRLFRAFAAACMFTFSIAIATFIFFPTYVRAATLQGDDIFTSLLRFFHQDAGRYDALPSGHIYITALLALFFSRWYPRQKIIWIVTLVIVSLSTLFTGQHYLLDVAGGYVAGFAGYYFGLWWAGFYSKQPERRMTSSSLD
jgi:membrane-associated phospholipid phosphatase